MTAVLPPAVPPPPVPPVPPAAAPRHVRARVTPEWATVASRALATAAVLAGFALAYLYGFSALENGRAQQGLYARLRSELAAGTAPTAAPIDRGVPVAALRADRAGLDDVVVLEGSDSATTEDGPGHLPSTPLPGQRGVSVVVGRATGFGGPFADLDRLRPGDVLTAVTGQGEFRYRVAHVGVTAAPQVSVTPGAAVLVLVTAAEPGAWGSSGDAVLSVEAVLEGTPAAVTGALPRADEADRPLAGDRSVETLLELVLSLQALAGALALLVVGRSRWRPDLAWLVASPAILATLWITASVAIRLLPNVM